MDCYHQQVRGVRLRQEGDIAVFGRLIFESGGSSINSYKTGSLEIKVLYDAMRSTNEIYGRRFSGAGFKGCCMGLIDPAYKDEIIRSVTEKYISKFSDLKDSFSIHYCKTADGVMDI